MPYGYLIGVVLMGMLVLAALRPPRRPRRLALAAYFVGLMINEVPLPFLAFLLWSTIDSVWFGTLLDTPAGWVVLAAGLLVAAGMVYLQVRATRARPAVRAALQEIAPDEPLRPTTPLWMSRLIPLPLRPRTVERVPKLRYAPGGREHTLDLYRRRDLAGPAPVLIYLHAGGYFSGNKRFGGRLLINRMAARGWVVVSANYGLRPRVGYPEHLIDVKRVIAWIHREADRYGMDTRTIVASGSSAGAHLSMLAALTPGDPVFQPGFEDVDTRLAGAVGLFGYYGRYYGRTAAEVPASTPFALDPRDAPPAMIVHGDRDSYTPVEAARAMAGHLDASARPVVYAELPGAQHGFDLVASERFEAVVDGIEVFLSRTAAEYAVHVSRHIGDLTVAAVYPLYVSKVERKGRSKAELDEVIRWLTGFDEAAVQQQIDDGATFEEFFARASLNPNASLITGVICGVRVEEIEDPLTQKVRYLDKLVDEVAKGKSMDKVLRAG